MAEPYTAVPLSPLRKIIASRMTAAKQLIPHFRLTIDIEVDALLSVRSELNANSSSKVSINDFLIKACAYSLMKHPAINVQFEDDQIRQYHQADISVVVAVEGGLSTPIVRGADLKSVLEIGAEMKTLAARATAGQLRMQEIVGGSFSISNLGAYGVDQFDAIINPPQAAILAVGSAKQRAIVTEAGEIRIAKVLRVTLSVDHRCIDGVVGAEFLSTLRETVEQPMQLLARSVD